MKFYNFDIVIEKEPEDAGYFAYAPSLPGCLSNGKTIEETRHNIREAVIQHLTACRDRKIDIPQRDSVVHVEELAVGVME